MRKTFLTLLILAEMSGAATAQDKIKLTKKILNEHGDTAGPAGMMPPLWDTARRGEETVIEQKGSRITYTPSTGNEPTRGKQYGTVVLKAGVEFSGYLDVRGDGSVRVSENPLYENVKMSEVKNIRWHDKVVVKVKGGDSIFGHLMGEEGGQLLVETLSEPRTVVRISLSDIEQKSTVRNLEVGKRRYSRPKLALIGGGLYALGQYSSAFAAGPATGLSLEQNISRFFRRESFWFPDLRVDANIMQFRNNGFNYQAAYVNAGPKWILNGLSQHKGALSVAMMPGIAFESVSSPAVSGGRTSYSFSMLAGLSYEYPVFRQLSVGVDLRGLYSFDSAIPLFAIGAGLRTSYQF